MDQDTTLETGELHKSSGCLVLRSNIVTISNILLLKLLDYPQESMGCPLAGLWNSLFIPERQRRHADGGGGQGVKEKGQSCTGISAPEP